MVIRGKLRGNGSQLANYLLKKADNENVRLLVIQGTVHDTDLNKSLVEMSLTSELTKSDKGLYHVQICPAYGEDKSMTDADWLRAADILEQETGYVGQKRALVIHHKNGKAHAHVVWERYCHDKEIMLPNHFSRLAQNRARMTMEKEFSHMRTPERNPNRPEMKSFLTNAWLQTSDAGSFMSAVSKNGYVIAAGTQRPYMVVDNTGRSFDLVRQLSAVKTKEVRERFKETKLIKEKEAIQLARAQCSLDKHYGPNISKPAENDNSKETEKQKLLDKLRAQRREKARKFRENERDM